VIYLACPKRFNDNLQVNVLIDDAGKAVLCDFGLTRIKADVTSRTVKVDGGGVIGSRNWMAPERLLRGSLKPPCDIYAFGMTLYEVSHHHSCRGYQSDSSA
jgi:serine/threonine protein kinase